MRLVTIAQATAWTVVPLAVAEPIASGICAFGLFGLETPWRLTTRQILTSVPFYLWNYPGSPSVHFWATVGVGTALAIVVVPTGYLAYALFRRRRRLYAMGWGRTVREPERAASRVHGDADWLTMQEAAEIFPGEHPDWGGIPVGEAYRPDLDMTKRGFKEDDPETWGRGGQSPLLLSPLTTGAISGIIIAGSGSYKTVSFTIPAMCTWRGSVVVLDPSAQVGRMVAGLRRSMGHTVALLDPGAPKVGFNVLDCINLAHPLATTHMMEFVDWCMPEPDGGGDSKNGKFFAESARELAVCILADMLSDPNLPSARKTVREWRSRLVTPEEEMKKLLEDIYGNSANRFARDLAGTMMRTYKETWSSIYKHVTSHTGWLSNNAFADLLSGDAFRASDLAAGRLTVIVQIPDEALKTTPAVARVIIGALARTVLRAKGKVATPVPFILDEMDLLGPMPILAVLRDLGRKSGVGLFPMWQSTGQIEKTWGKDGKKSWYASAAFRLYAMVNDEETADEVSKRCGSYTVLARTEGKSTTAQGGFSATGRSWGYSGNVSEQRKELVSPYEVQTALRPDEAIVIPKGRRALRCGRPLFWRRPEMADLVEADQYHRVATESFDESIAAGVNCNDICRCGTRTTTDADGVASDDTARACGMERAGR